MTLGLNADTASFTYFYSSIKYGLDYDTYFTLGVWLGLLGCEAIYTLQSHKPFKTISNYGENFIFTYTRIQLGTQLELHHSNKTFSCTCLYFVCTLKHFIWTSANLLFLNAGNKLLNILLSSCLGFFHYCIYRNLWTHFYFNWFFYDLIQIYGCTFYKVSAGSSMGCDLISWDNFAWSDHLHIFLWEQFPFFFMVM